jgi:threonine dehydratase
VLAHPQRFRARRVGLVLSGGNIDPLLLAAIIERGLARSGRLARLVVDVRDAPGALARVTALLAEERANIEQIHHERAFGTKGAQRVEVEFVVQTESAAHVERVLRRLHEGGFEARAE